MPRNNRGTRKRRFDTRLSFAELARLLNLNVRQRLALRRFMIERFKDISKGVSNLEEE